MYLYKFPQSHDSPRPLLATNSEIFHPWWRLGKNPSGKKKVISTDAKNGASLRGVAEPVSPLGKDLSRT
jgi:hypothetical protein